MPKPLSGYRIMGIVRGRCEKESLSTHLESRLINPNDLEIMIAFVTNSQEEFDTWFFIHTSTKQESSHSNYFDSETRASIQYVINFHPDANNSFHPTSDASWKQLIAFAQQQDLEYFGEIDPRTNGKRKRTNKDQSKDEVYDFLEMTKKPWGDVIFDKSHHEIIQQKPKHYKRLYHFFHPFALKKPEFPLNTFKEEHHNIIETMQMQGKSSILIWGASRMGKSSLAEALLPNGFMCVTHDSHWQFFNSKFHKAVISHDVSYKKFDINFILNLTDKCASTILIDGFLLELPENTIKIFTSNEANIFEPKNCTNDQLTAILQRVLMVKISDHVFLNSSSASDSGSS